jgi:hypothetical protein
MVITETISIKTNRARASAVQVIAVRFGANGGDIAVDEAIADRGAVQRTIVFLTTGIIHTIRMGSMVIIMDTTPLTLRIGIVGEHCVLSGKLKRLPSVLETGFV